MDRHRDRLAHPPLPQLIEHLRRFPTLEALRRSAWYHEHRRALARLLNTPELYPSPGARPRLRAFIRAVQWNIEKGKAFDGLVEILSRHPVLKYADLIFLNEVDDGMARSGNRHVARELGARLHMHVAFAPAHLELTKGWGDDVHAPGENRGGRQGNALLSRYPLGDVRIVELPAEFELFEFAEKRFGRRVALVAEVLIDGKPLIAIGVHLEVRTTPRGRARQMAALMETLDRWSMRGPALLAGDLNTHTFSRGTRWRTIHSTARLLLASPPRLKQRLLRPHRSGSEPLFAILEQRGFEIDAFNSSQPTHRSHLTTLEDADHLPGPIRSWVLSRLARYDHRLDMKLDWMAGRDVRALRAGELTDAATGITSLDPQAIPSLVVQGRPLADHDPIVVDIRLAGGSASRHR
ncbi:MAG: hypothetical protein D6723_18215 [Acidobacteria bacterium]|nr:MAG: hypothetical protein D6723_18215 [Acidobacteriota bacterium]